MQRSQTGGRGRGHGVAAASVGGSEEAGNSPLENALVAVRALAGSHPQFPLIPNDLHEALDLQEQVNAYAAKVNMHVTALMKDKLQ
eukprot:COSAG02_NODE_1799_length_10896_cov_8.648421_7_plen_86_part_00